MILYEMPKRRRRKDYSFVGIKPLILLLIAFSFFAGTVISYFVFLY